MGSELSTSEPPPEPDENEKAAFERDRAFVDRKQREDPEHVAKVRDATRRRLGLVDTTPSPHSSDAPPSTAEIKLSEYDFPFENLVFEGGGGKGRIYGGALKVSRFTILHGITGPADCAQLLLRLPPWSSDS